MVAISAPVLPDAVHTLAESRTPLGDVSEPDSDAWWVKLLAEELTTRRRRIEPLWQRYKGNAALPELGNPAASAARARVWKAFQRKARMNLEELIVRSIAERLTPIGCRVDSAPAPGTRVPGAGTTGVADAVRIGTGDRSTDDGVDEQRNATARRVWLGNRMAIQAGEIIEKFLVMGASYAIVGPPDDDVDPTIPVITAEDPRYVITYQDPARPQRTLAGLKLYHDPVRGRDVGWLYLPGRAVRFERTGGRDGTSALSTKRFRFNPADWSITDERNLRPYIGNRVAVAVFENHDAEGEFENHIDHLDRVNHMILQRIVVATLQAFKQRAVKGVPTRDPKTQEPIDYTDIFTNDPGALWLLPATAELWESGVVDLTPLLSSVRDDVRDLAAVLRLPVQHFMPDAANGSAEGAAASKEGLVYRAEDRQTRGDVGFADMMSLAFGYLGSAAGGDGASLTDPGGTATGADTGAPSGAAVSGTPSPVTITTLWRPIERYSLAEKHDAASKANGILPWEDIMIDIYGYEPDDLPRLRQHRADDMLLAPAAAGEAGSRAAATSGGTGATDARPSSAGQSGTEPTGGPAGDGSTGR